jgi:peroxiredoxin
VTVPFFLSYGALWVLMTFQTLVLLALVHRLHSAQTSSTGPGLSGEQNGDPRRGQPAPTLRAVDVFGTPIDSADFAGTMTALLFVSPNCSSCSVTLDEMERTLKTKTDGHVVLVCRAGADDCISLAEMYDVSVPVVADEDLAISRLFGIVSVPTAVLINESNRIHAYGQPMAGEELTRLLQEAAREATG